MAAAKTPEKDLSEPLRETLKLARKGRTAPEIAERRQVTSSAVYGAFRRLEELGFASELPERNGRGGNGNGNGMPTRPRTAVEQVLASVEEQRTTIAKQIENIREEATALDARAASLREDADAKEQEFTVLGEMANVAK